MLACGDSSSATTQDTGATDTDSESGTDGGAAHVYELEQNVSQACLDAMDQLAEFLLVAGDGPAMSAAYEGTALQIYIQQLDSENARGDNSAVVAALAAGTPEDLIDAELWVHSALLEGLRTYVAAPQIGVENPYAVWDDAFCIWEGALQGPAVTAESWSAGASYVDDIAAPVNDAFQSGNLGILGEPPAASIDEWLNLPAKQIIEKNQYRVIHRHVLHHAAEAQTSGDALAARRALRWFEMFEHRIAERNTPGIEIIKGQLADPALIDTSSILRELNVAFAKRTNGYTSLAVDGGEVGVPNGYSGAVEGTTYATLIYPDMVDRLAGFDLTAYEDAWESYKEAVRGDDLAAAETHSATLKSVNCDYQEQVLGIAACTASDDEPSA